MKQTIAEKRAYNRAWHKLNRKYVNAVRAGEKAAVHNVAARFRVTPDQARHLIRERGKGCRICRILGLHRSGRFVIDHSHITGRVRGILCDFHNVLVGYLEKTSDDEKKLAFAYIAVAEAVDVFADPYDIQAP